MVVKVSSRLATVDFPPIAEALSWIVPNKSNRPLLNMCQAVPSYPPAEELQIEIGVLARLPTMGGYTDIFGIPQLRQAFSEHISTDYSTSVNAENVAITTGCNQAFAAAVMAIAQSGDNVVMPAPYYFNHQMWLSMLGIKIKSISAFGPHGNWPSVAEARKAITSRTKAIMLCSPNNPTGAIYPAHVLREFYDLAEEAGIALIIDETYKDFRPDNAPPHSLLQLPNWDKTLIQLFSFSKIYALAGYRLGAMIAGPHILHEAAKILDTMTICPPQITQRAVLYALTNLDEWKQGKRQLMAERLAALRASFTDANLQYKLISSGAYFAYVQHPFKGKTSKEVAKSLVQKNDVLCLPGSMFGPKQENYLRFAFANVETSLMPQLIERLNESVSR